MKVLILGTRGVPAGHSGFETFAQQFALYLVERGHSVYVYCQLAKGTPEFRDMWNGIHRIAFSEGDHPAGTIRFDLRTVIDASKQKDSVVLTLGYNTALFSVLYRLHGIRNYMNMDGIEWKRQKWSRLAKFWLRANEWLGSHLANHLVADHPEIKNHLLANVPASKVTIIPYGADQVTGGEELPIRELGLEPGKYILVIARSEPENSILEIIKAHTTRERDYPLVILGKYRPESNRYHARVVEAAKSHNVIMPGPIFERNRVEALRFYATAYVHGHQVGGTNPSLVEALAASNAVIAHNNKFNRWVCGPEAKFFDSVEDLSNLMDLVVSGAGVRQAMRDASTQRFLDLFQKERIMFAYEELMLGHSVNDGIWELH